MIRFCLVCLPYWIFVDYIFVRLNLTSSKQFKKNFYDVRTRLFAGQREWPSSYDCMVTKVQKLLNLFQTSRNFTVMFLVTCRFANRDIKFENGCYHGNRGTKIMGGVTSAISLQWQFQLLLLLYLHSQSGGYTGIPLSVPKPCVRIQSFVFCWVLFIFGILVGHDLSMHILYRFHGWLIFARVIALIMFPYELLL